MIFDTQKEFDKEFNKLLKKYHTLEDDMDLLKKFLRVHPRGFPPRHVRINNTGVETEIYKVKHFRCKALKHKGSRSGIRVIYAYMEDKDRIEFVEIYYKEKDDVECDKGRIKRYYAQ